MADIPLPIQALLNKLPQIDSKQHSFGDYLRAMGLRFDETSNKYRVNFVLDSELSDSDQLIFISMIMKTYIIQESITEIKQKEVSQQKKILDSSQKPILGNENKTPKKKIDYLKKGKIHEVRKLRLKIKQLQHRIQRLQHGLKSSKCRAQRLSKMIPPEPTSEETTHYLTVTKLEKPNWFRMGRVQKRNIRRRLMQIAKDEGFTYETVVKRTKFFVDIPHSIDTAGNLRQFLKKNKIPLQGRTQKFEFKKGDKLYDLIKKFTRGTPNLPEAARIMENRLMTDFFPIQ